jgi:hypothetical protein
VPPSGGTRTPLADVATAVTKRPGIATYTWGGAGTAFDVTQFKDTFVPGGNGPIRAAMYGVAGDYQKTANDEILVIPMIETRQLSSTSTRSSMCLGGVVAADRPDQIADVGRDRRPGSMRMVDGNGTWNRAARPHQGIALLSLPAAFLISIENHAIAVTFDDFLDHGAEYLKHGRKGRGRRNRGHCVRGHDQADLPGVGGPGERRRAGDPYLRTGKARSPRSDLIERQARPRCRRVADIGGSRPVGGD